VPEFQRNFVWSMKQSSLLIESFLLGLPVPQIFLHVNENNRYLVIDGQQRILSVVYYLDGYFGEETTHARRRVFRLQGLSDRSPYGGKKFLDLDPDAQRKLKGAVLRAINIRQIRPTGDPTSIYHIFERLNTGGTPLKPQEIRNCVFRGNLVNELRRLNEDANWREIIGKSTFDRHQKDVELVLRLFALACFWRDYESPLKGFLNKTLRDHRDAKSPEVTKFKRDFPRLTQCVIEALGDKPFHIRRYLNAAVLDSVMSVLFSVVGTPPDDLKERYDRLKADEGYLDLVSRSTADSSRLRERFDLAQRFLIG